MALTARVDLVTGVNFHMEEGASAKCSDRDGTHWLSVRDGKGAEMTVFFLNPEQMEMVAIALWQAAQDWCCQSEPKAEGEGLTEFACNSCGKKFLAYQNSGYAQCTQCETEAAAMQGTGG